MFIGIVSVCKLSYIETMRKCGCTRLYVVAFGLNKKVRREGLFRGGLRSLKRLHLNDNVEFDSAISYIMFYMIIFWPVKYIQ